MIAYILSSSLCSGLLLLAYRILLLPEKLYKFNRFYLLFSLVFSLFVPLISIPVPYNKPTSLNQQAIVPMNAAFVRPMGLTAKDQIAKANYSIPVNEVIVEKWTSNYYIIAFISSIITIVMCFRLVCNLCGICLDINYNTIVNLNDIKIVLLDKNITPYSFLKYVFVNKNDFINDLTEPEIICHEQAHANQLHSLDIIFIEILQAICWFNPFIFLYRNAMRLNHEFLADEVVLKNNYDTTAYQYLVLAKMNQSGSTYLTSQFNYLTTKKRLIMMTKKTSGKTAFYKQLAIVPILVSAVIVFAHANGMGNTAPKVNKLTVGNLFFLQSDKFSNVNLNGIFKSNIPNAHIQTVTVQMTDTPRCMAKKQKHIADVPIRKPAISDISKNTFSTKAPAAFGIQDARKNTFSTKAPAVSGIQDARKNTFSTEAVVHDGNTKNTFSTAMGKERSNSSDMLDFTNKLILIRGKEATESELSTLSLKEIKFIKPFKGTDDLGNGTFENIYGKKAKNGGFWVVLKSSDN